MCLIWEWQITLSLKPSLVFSWSSLTMTKVERSHLQITKNNQLWEVTLDEVMLNWPGNFFEASLLLTHNFFISLCHWCLAGYNFSFSHLDETQWSRDYGDSGREFLQRDFPPLLHNIRLQYGSLFKTTYQLKTHYQTVRVTIMTYSLFIF